MSERERPIKLGKIARETKRSEGERERESKQRSGGDISFVEVERGKHKQNDSPSLGTVYHAKFDPHKLI